MVIVSEAQGSSVTIVPSQGDEVFNVFNRQVVGQGRDLTRYLFTEDYQTTKLLQHYQTTTLALLDQYFSIILKPQVNVYFTVLIKPYLLLESISRIISRALTKMTRAKQKTIKGSPCSRYRVHISRTTWMSHLPTYKLRN